MRRRVSTVGWAMIGLALISSSLTPTSRSVAQDFDRAALDRIVSGRDTAERDERRREAAIGRQLSLLYYLPWRSGIGPGSYYWGAPYGGPPYPGITASYSAGAFYGNAYGVAATNTTGQGRGALLALAGGPAQAAPERAAADGFIAQPDQGQSPPVLSTALYGPYGIGGVGAAGSVNPLFAGLPGWLNAFEPTPFIPGYIYGYPYVGAVEQPVGHRILSAGAKGYIYEPVYASDADNSGEANSVGSVGQPSANASSDVSINAELQVVERLTSNGRRLLGDAVESFQRQSYTRAIKSLDALKLETDPHFPAELLRAQTLFALGKYDAADAALQLALQGLPETKWGLIVENYLDYYLLPKPFEWQLRNLERYMADHPNSAPAARLLGYEYGFLGYPAEAFAYFQRANSLAPGDRITSRLQQRFAGLANQQRAERGEAPVPLRAPKVPRPEGVDENGEDTSREF